MINAVLYSDQVIPANAKVDVRLGQMMKGRGRLHMNGFWVPKRTPKDVITKLNAAAMDALADSVVNL